MSPRSVLKVAQGLSVELGKALKLDEVHPSLAVLNLGNEARGPSKFLGGLPLG